MKQRSKSSSFPPIAKVIPLAQRERWTKRKFNESKRLDSTSLLESEQTDSSKSILRVHPTIEMDSSTATSISRGYRWEGGVKRVTLNDAKLLLSVSRDGPIKREGKILPAGKSSSRDPDAASTRR